MRPTPRNVLLASVVVLAGAWGFVRISAVGAQEASQLSGDTKTDPLPPGQSGRRQKMEVRVSDMAPLVAEVPMASVSRAVKRLPAAGAPYK